MSYTNDILIDILRLNLHGWDESFSSHPLLRPSGPSSVARHSSVNKTVWKSVLKYRWAHSSRLVLCLAVNGGRMTGLVILAILWSNLHLDVLGTSGTPAFWNACLTIGFFIVIFITYCQSAVIWTSDDSPLTDKRSKRSNSLIQFRSSYTCLTKPRHKGRIYCS